LMALASSTEVPPNFMTIMRRASPWCKGTAGLSTSHFLPLAEGNAPVEMTDF
jgi:hypothetical protein